MKKNISNILVIFAYLVMVVFNYLAVTLPLAGRDTGAISDSYPNLFAPAGYTFSIWGLIYLLLAAYVVYQFTRPGDKLTGQINRIFLPNALLNAAWLLAWHYDVIWLSVIIMIGLLYSLIRIADLLRGKKLSGKEQWLVRLPFSIYFGWITVATIANITILLVSLGWNGFGLPEVFWTVVVLLTGAAIGVWRTILDRNVAYALVLIWAYGGILAKHLSVSGFAGQYPTVIYTVILAMLVFAGTAIYVGLKGKNNRESA